MTDRLLDGPALARSLGRPEQTLRKWAMDGLIERRGKDRRGRTLYSINEVVTVAAAHPGRRRAVVSTPEGSTTRVPGPAD